MALTPDLNTGAHSARCVAWCSGREVTSRLVAKKKQAKDEGASSSRATARPVTTTSSRTRSRRASCSWAPRSRRCAWAGPRLVDGWASFTGDELWLEGVHIPEYSNGTWNNHTPRRRRKLLLHRRELDKILHKTRETGHTVVPLSLYFKDGRAKVEIAIAKGKKEYDKRHALRERQDNREADRAHRASTGEAE